VDAHGRLVVLDELDEGLDGVLVSHVAVVITEGDEAGRGAH
jgi:Fe-S cluster assembly ATPase SufC